VKAGADPRSTPDEGTEASDGDAAPDVGDPTRLRRRLAAVRLPEVAPMAHRGMAPGSADPALW
jgi:hypothetical protein